MADDSDFVVRDSFKDKFFNHILSWIFIFWKELNQLFFNLNLNVKSIYLFRNFVKFLLKLLIYFNQIVQLILKPGGFLIRRLGLIKIINVVMNLLWMN